MSFGRGAKALWCGIWKSSARAIPQNPRHSTAEAPPIEHTLPIPAARGPGKADDQGEKQPISQPRSRVVAGQPGGGVDTTMKLQ